MNSATSDRQTILLTGATGYVGGRLVKPLEASGHQLRCLARRPEYLAPRVSDSTEIVQGDLLDAPTLEAALAGVDVAYYLVHSMADSGSFETLEQTAAQNFASAASKAGVKRIIYLGGLGKGEDLSPHLASRQETGRILRESGVQTIEFRSSIIIGSGSLSFEMLRALTNKLPVMVTPRWVKKPTQPIAIEDIVAFLLAAADADIDDSEIVEIGGPDRVSYGDLMREFARQQGLRRLMVPVPFLTPWLSSLWLGLVTPVYARVGRKLIDSIANETVVESDVAGRLFDIRPRGYADAIGRALANEDRELAETRWSDAVSSRGSSKAWGGMKFGSRLVDSRSTTLSVSPTEAFKPIEEIGGDRGWYFGNWLWRVRGFLDILAGGVGMRRGRRHPHRLVVGDPLDFWRVEEVEAPNRLRLSAEMKVPGRAWLTFEVEANETGGSTIRQTAVFDPAGLFGLAYWYGIYPLHALIFAGMLRGIARAAESGH